MPEFNTGSDNYHEGNFLLLYNKYYTEDDPQQLTPKELYTLLILKEYSSKLTGKVVTTYNLMGHLLPFTNLSEKKKNAAIAKSLMQSLRAKGVIEYDEPKDANDPVIVDIESVKYVQNDSRTSFQPIPDFILKRTIDPDELYVLIVVHNIAKMCDKGEYSKPYFRNKKNWGTLLSKGDSTAEKIVNRMCEKKILYYYENDTHYDREKNKFEQRQGKYYLFPQEHEEERIAKRDMERETRREIKR